MRLGIVPRITVKYLYLMKGSCIYKTCANGRVYRVIEESIPHFADVCYRLYVGRRLYQGINCFYNCAEAVESIKELVDLECRTLKMEGRV